MRENNFVEIGRQKEYPYGSELAPIAWCVKSGATVKTVFRLRLGSGFDLLSSM